MADRKQFLATLSASGALLAAARAAAAATASPSSDSVGSSSAPSAAPSSPPPRKPAAKGPSAAALAVAATMRRFDAKLTDAELATIAGNIDAGWQAGAALNSRKKPLQNWDEPVTVFGVRPK